MIWFTADTHFAHTNIIKYCKRPFANTDEMDDTIIKNINAVVQPQDTLYHLGDFAFRDVCNYRRRIHCQTIHFIMGNHDKFKTEDRKCFSSIHQMHQIHYNKQTIVLNHYGMRVWNKSHHGSIHLFGHSHGELPPLGKSMDVGVDCWDFKPISAEFVIKHMNTKSITVNHKV